MAPPSWWSDPMASSSGHWPLASSSSPPSASTSEASSRLPPWASAYLESEALRQWPPCKRKRPQPGQSVTSPMASEMASQPSRQWPHSESSPVNSEMASEASNQGPPWVFSPVASEAPWVSMPRWASRPVASESEASSELPPGSSMMSSWNSPQEPEPEPEH